MPLLSIVEYARKRHCHINAVHYAVRAGRIKTTAEGLIDSDTADHDWSVNTAKHAGPGAKVEVIDEDNISFAAARARKEAFIAKMRELDYEVRIGTLAEVSAMEREAFTFYRRLRDAAFNIPDRIAATLAGENDGETIRRILHDELEEVFTSFAVKEKIA